MKVETMRIYFLIEFSVCCRPNILLSWQRDVTTSPFFEQVPRNQLNASGKTARWDQAYKTGTSLEVKLKVNFYPARTCLLQRTTTT